jgi:hypothetical protein
LSLVIKSFSSVIRTTPLLWHVNSTVKLLDSFNQTPRTGYASASNHCLHTNHELMDLSHDYVKMADTPKKSWTIILSAINRDIITLALVSVQYDWKKISFLMSIDLIDIINYMYLNDFSFSFWKSPLFWK